MFLPFIVFDAISAFFICIASLWIRFDFSITKLLENVAYLDKAIKFSPVYRDISFTYLLHFQALSKYLGIRWIFRIFSNNSNVSFYGRHPCGRNIFPVTYDTAFVLLYRSFPSPLLSLFDTLRL